MTLKFPVRLLLALLFLLTAASAWSMSIIVNTTADSTASDGLCSLREAVQAANTNQAVDTCQSGQPGGDQILISIPGTILLDDLLLITESVSIVGVGRDEITLSGQNQHRIFQIETLGDSDAVTLLGMTLSQGVSIAGGGAIHVTRIGNLVLTGLRLVDNGSDTPGGAVYVRPETGLSTNVRITDCLFEHNQGSFGGALYLSSPGDVLPTAKITDSLFSENQASRGGGIFIDRVASTEISRTVFTGNTAQTPGSDPLSGGAVHVFNIGSSTERSVSIDSSSMIDNYSDAGGGALYVDGAYTTTLINSTIHGNSSDTTGADGIDLDGGASLQTFYSTLADNGIGLIDDLAVTVCDTCDWQSQLSIVSTSWPTTSNCDSLGSISSQGYNIDTSGDCLASATDTSSPAGLSPLSDVTIEGLAFAMPVRKPGVGSAAVDGSTFTTCQVPPAQFLGTDQLGRSRPGTVGGGTALCDIGAIELQPEDVSPSIFSDRFELP